MKKIYYYFFYKLYKFWETAPARFWSEWKTSLSLMVIQIWIIFSIINYIEIFFSEKLIIISDNDNLSLIIIAGILIIIDYFTFHHLNQWKAIIKQFDKLSRKKNTIGGVIVWGIILFIFANLIFSFYLFYQS